MRELKFRGKKTESFHDELGYFKNTALLEFFKSTGDWITTDNLALAIRDFPEYLEDSIGAMSWFWSLVDRGNIDPATVGQWTGLVDKNGKDVYWGDTMNIFGELFCVEYFCGDWVMMSQNKYGGWLHLATMLRKPDAPIVIGNIHEVKP